MGTTICGITVEKGGRMASFKEKCHQIGDMLTKLDKNDKKIILKYIIMHDLNLYTEVLFEEQRRLEKELHINCDELEVVEDDCEENVSFDDNISDSKDGYLGYTGGNI